VVHEMVQEGLHLEIKNNLSEVAQVTEAIAQFSAQSGLPHDVNHALQLVAEEMLSNIILHGFPQDSSHTIMIDLEAKSGEVHLLIKDNGIQFNLLEHAIPKKPGSLDEFKIGGLGIPLVRSNVDEISYRYENGWNTVLLTKRLNSK
jgi:serine/threonine-protein kinase RsbW